MNDVKGLFDNTPEFEMNPMDSFARTRKDRRTVVTIATSRAHKPILLRHLILVHDRCPNAIMAGPRTEDPFSVVHRDS